MIDQLPHVGLAAIGALVLASLACGGRGAPRTASERTVELTVVISESHCYVVCDSVRAEIRGDGLVARSQRGQRLDQERRAAAVQGADTVRVVEAALDSLRQALTQFQAAHLPADFQQGIPPCSPWMSLHTPVTIIEWRDGSGTHRLRYDAGCGEPTGLPERIVRHARHAARLDRVPVHPR